jgi:hypothetical protein
MKADVVRPSAAKPNDPGAKKKDCFYLEKYCEQ